MNPEESVHKPVMLGEITKIFDPRPGQKFIDATANGGGHLKAIFKKIQPGGRVLGIDWDCDLIEKLKSSPEFNKDNSLFICDNYANLESIAAKHNFVPDCGVLFDLGFSSYHIEKSERGFSFVRSEPLDMRYNRKSNDVTAEKIVNTWPEKTIADIIYKFGEERFSRRIARAICESRKRQKIKTTDELVRVVKAAVPRHGKINPATRTFQALRIAVNKEFENEEKGIRAAVDILRAGGRVAIISFHSLEDRIAKNEFKRFEKIGVLKILTPKPLVPSDKEISENPRARSAKLRVAEKMAIK